jgi:hypothetical protein
VVHVIELLTQARRQYKQLKSTRMTRFLAVQIANEYRDAGQYERAFRYVGAGVWGWGCGPRASRAGLSVAMQGVQQGHRGLSSGAVVRARRRHPARRSTLRCPRMRPLARSAGENWG